MPPLKQVCSIENLSWSCLAQKVYDVGWEAQTEQHIINIKIQIDVDGVFIPF